MSMNQERKMVLTAIGLLATLSLFVFPSTNMIAHAQLGNNTSQVLTDAQGKLSNLTEKFNQFLRDSGVNLTVARDGNLSSKLQNLENSSTFKALSEKFAQAVQELKANMTNLGNITTNIGELKQEVNSSLTQLIQKLQDLKNNP